MRIKKKQIREKLDTAELEQNANKIVDVAGNVKNQFKSIGMTDDEAASAVADTMSIGTNVSEINLDEVGDDFGDIPTGQDIEVGADNYELYQKMLKALSDEDDSEGTIDYGETTPGDSTPGLPFESVNPKMTKDQLMESVLGKKQRRVIKTIKVKDLK
jgi:hypothetical protein